MSITNRIVVAMLVASTVFLRMPASHAASYDSHWSRTSAQSYAWHGLSERYVLGGGKFINNDRWDSACSYACSSVQEGIDCSGFAAKVYAVPYLTNETTV